MAISSGWLPFKGTTLNVTSVKFGVFMNDEKRGLFY